MLDVLVLVNLGLVERLVEVRGVVVLVGDADADELKRATCSNFLTSSMVSVRQSREVNSRFPGNELPEFESPTFVTELGCPFECGRAEGAPSLASISSA